MGTAMMKLIGICLVSILVLSAPPAMAASLYFSATLDLDTPGLFYASGLNSLDTGLGFSPLTPQQVSDDDLVTITYDFGGRGVSFDRVVNAAAQVSNWDPLTQQPVDGGQVELLRQIGVLWFLDANGQVILRADQPRQNGVRLGVIFQALNIGPITFFGLRYEGFVHTPPGYTGTYNLPGITVTGILHQPAVTPIPAALPLFASALGGLGFVGWKRRKRTAAKQHP
jgi:hypothetical protein